MLTIKQKSFEFYLGKKNALYKHKLRLKPTKAEKEVMTIFNSLKLRHIFQKGFYLLKGKYKGYHCIVDFYIPMLKLAIEVDGGYHNSVKQIRKDKFKDKILLQKRKIKVIRIKNCETNQIISRICQVLEQPRWNKNIHYKQFLTLINNEQKYS